MRIVTSLAANALGADLLGPDSTFDGASFDTRTLLPGQLFVALVADRDGHDFIDAAVTAGATAVLASDRHQIPEGVSAIVVDDTAAALMQLAQWARAQLDVPIVGVTGSVGKTSTKDLIAASLAPTMKVAANERSFNNEQGLPVTILNAPDDVEVLVLEMGMRGFGEIARLAGVASPTMGVVTRVAASHTEFVGGIDGVMVAKRELVEALGADGTAILNADDERVAAMADHTAAEVVTYGRHGDVKILKVQLDEFARPTVDFVTPWGAASVSLSVPGAHMASNAAAALAVAGRLTGSIEAASSALSEAAISGGRMEVAVTASGATVINDAYNANPDSMAAALAALDALSARRKIAVLGAMAELDDPVGGHHKVAVAARELGIELIAVATELYGVNPLVDADAAVVALADIGEGDAVLVKASNSARLWEVSEALLASPAN